MLGVRALWIVELSRAVSGVSLVTIVTYRCDCLPPVFLTTLLISGAPQKSRNKISGVQLENAVRDVTLAYEMFCRDLDDIKNLHLIFLENLNATIVKDRERDVVLNWVFDLFWCWKGRSIFFLVKSEVI